MFKSMCGKQSDRPRTLKPNQRAISRVRLYLSNSMMFLFLSPAIL